MTITGYSLIGNAVSSSTGAGFRAFNPALGQDIEPLFHTASEVDVAQACALAVFLETIAQNIIDIGDELIERAMAESALPKARLEGERGRTVGQLRLFAAVLREGSWSDARIDPALPDRQPLPRVDLRLRNIAIGPVVVFGASNFPLAFSVAGGDTASALAAGCPVVVKAHPAHPGTSELVGRAIVKAVAACHLPQGVFSLLTGVGYELGTALVQNPAIQAVGFTGSRQGGLALMKVAAGRPQPIPVYAEMSSINPTFVLPQALAVRSAGIAKNFVDSLTMGVGQFCTNPGLVLGLAGADFEGFAAAAGQELKQRAAATMLTAGIHQAYENGIAKLGKQPDVERLAHGLAGTASCAAVPTLFGTSGAAFLSNPALAEEVFGPVSLLIACRDEVELVALTEHLEGQLTATLQMEEGDKPLVRRLLPVLERKVGRILVNGFPTGVEVSHAMVHGGPFPATSDGRTTSVGSAAISRFLRPVSYQNLSQDLLPAAIQDANPLGIWQRRDGHLVK
jgi:alpha-ketoglutaric semialdehyde dehydrogenase